MSRPSRIGILVLAIGSLLCGFGPALTQVTGPEQQSVYGRADVNVPPPTEVGEWEGTWFYVSRNRRMALWFGSPEAGTPVKFQFESKSGMQEQFTTDWEGKAIYKAVGRPGSFEMKFTERTDEHISGDWDWKVGDESFGRNRTADFNLYRIGDGRTLVMLVTNSHTEQFGGPGSTSTLAKQVWTFRKATRRHARWAELPF